MNRFLLAALLALSADVLLAEQQWGDFVGRVVLQGDAPTAKRLSITVDQKVLTKPIFDESLVVNADNGGIANVLVYLRERRSSQLPVHPSYAKTANAKVELKVADGRFEPHVLLLRTTQTMLQINQQNLGYHPRIDFIQNEPR